MPPRCLFKEMCQACEIDETFVEMPSRYLASRPVGFAKIA
jgi:hypothetical protein